MPMATKFAQRKKIKKLVKNKRNQKNNLAKNFYFFTNINLIAKNNLNINEFHFKLSIIALFK
jgi:hypothetical protein